MSKVFGDIPNLVNGISQQAPSLRLPSQCEINENVNPTLLDGLTPRPHTRHLAKLYASLPDNAFTHIILRDDAEKYVLVITTTDIRIYDFEGNLQSLTNSSGTYLSGLTNPREQVRALTVADYTFIVNKTKTVAAGSATAPARPYEAIYNVMAGNYHKRYVINVNGVDAYNYLTSDGSVAAHGETIGTEYIANVMYGGLVAAGLNTAPWAVGRYGHVVYLRNDSNDFTTTCTDDYSGRAMKCIKSKVQKFADLPTKGPDGIVFEVEGSEESSFDSYWVKLEGGDGSTSGTWKECPAPGTILGLDASTMPHTLVRNPDNSFTLAPATWDERKCGDLEKVPHPSFVGQKIEDVFFHRNRLGLLTNENIVMSEAGKFFNFFRTTLTALLDSDPIDVAASHVKVSVLRHAVPYQDVLLIFSDQTQFKLAGNELLTPKTVNARPVSEIPSIKNLRPVSAATSIFFVAERDQWASLFEYFLDKQLESADFDDVTSHCPAYIPAGVHTIACSPDLDIVLLATDGDPTAVYAYKFYYNGQEKLQSAWFRWRFPGADRVVNMAWDKGFLVLLVERNGDLHIERLNFEQRPFEEDGGFSIRLDRGSAIATGVYDDEADTTTFTVPHTVTDGTTAVTDSGGDLPKGIELTILSRTSSTITVSGDLSSQPIYVGLKYESRFRFSPFFYRGPDGKKTVTDGRLQVMHAILVYSKSAFFKIDVTPIGRATRTITFTGRVLSDPDNMTGVLSVADGKVSFPILSRNDRVTIDVYTDTWAPCAFTSAVWQGMWNKASREL